MNSGSRLAAVAARETVAELSGALSDEEVVERVRAGDTGLFEILMRRHNQRLYRATCGILGDPAETEDVIQDAYVRAYAHLDQFAGRSTFATWLTKIAVNESLARTRRRNRFVEIDGMTEPRKNALPPLWSQEKGPESQAVARSLQAALEAAIAALPDTYRPVVMLRDVQGLSTAEAAECLEVSEGAVKVRLHRGRAMLRREIAARSGEVLGRAFEFGAERRIRLTTKNSPAPTLMQPMEDPEELFLANLLLIEKLATLIGRRHHASVEEAEEFGSELKLKLVEDDYAVLRKFKGTSSLKTYLTTVAANTFRDFRDRRWGKWRPSAAAKELGPVAIRLEELLEKEGRGFDEACEILRTNHQVAESRRELEEIWKRLPPKTSRRMEGEEALQNIAAPGERPEERIFEHELRETRQRVSATLEKVLNQLSSEDKRIVRMSVVDSLKIVDVARMLRMEQKPLYRRRDKILKRLRSDLEREGVRWEQVADLLNRTDLGWGFSGRPAALPDTYRPVAMLRDVQGLSTAEAAECLELSEAAVKVRLHRGRAMLRREIAARSGEVLGRAFEFGAERCDRVVAGVLGRIV